jgi:DNA-binding protein HU-beta
VQTILAESAMRNGVGMPLKPPGGQGFSFRKGTDSMMSKSELIQKIADDLSLAKKDVKAVIESLADVGYKEMKKSGEFLLPGFAKFIVIKKPATKERTGINPFTKEPTVFKAKPARKMLKVRPVKAAKDAV